MLTNISFAMLSGFPPFQATSQDEIYRRAKSVEYDWPESGSNPRRCHNDIPAEAKNLVACLLKVDAETRPNPDEIVGHEFFSMHGGDAMPLTLDPSCRRQKPVWLLDQAPRGDVMDSITPRLELKSLARQCGVGQFRDNAQPFEIVGENVDLSLYKECVAEEQLGTSPEVPLPMDMVYTSAVSLKTWPSQRSPSPESPTSTLVNNEENSIPQPRLIEVLPQEHPLLPGLKPAHSRRVPLQSHAATLRAAEVVSMRSRALPRSMSSVAQPQNSAKAKNSENHSQPYATRRLLNELPLRPNTKTAAGGPPQAPGVPRQSSRVTRSATTKASALQSISDEHILEPETSDANAKRKERTAKTEARIAAAVHEEIEEAILGQRGSRRQKRTQPKVKTPNKLRSSVLISPDEVPETLTGTKPENVCHSLERLRDELARCLDHPSEYNRDLDKPFANGKKRANERPVIIKWVDYSHKFGIGYILENGTVGCLLNGENEVPTTCVAVAGAEVHLRKRKLSSYVDKHQVIHKDGSPVAFFEDCLEEGFRRVLVPAREYHIKGARGSSEELRHSNNDYDREKRERLYLWDKFARYMTQSLGKDDSADLEACPSDRETTPNTGEPVGPFIRFYQRLGNVGIWGFGDGSFQINFPDHTKLIVSHDGSWLDFYYLSVNAAQSLKGGEILEAARLVDRGVLRYPTSVMLSGSYRGHEFLRLIVENQLREKLAFVKDVVSIWSETGGLGCMGDQTGLRWKGMSEKGGKLVWVTIGAWGGDQRKCERRAT